MRRLDERDLQAPERLPLQPDVATLAYRIDAIDHRAVLDPRRAREPMLAFAELLAVDSVRFSASLRHAVRRRGGDVAVHTDLLVAAVGEHATVELSALDGLARKRLFDGWSPYRASPLAVAEMDLPTGGAVRYLRQGSLTLDLGEQVRDVPLLVGSPGVAGPPRLLAALRALGPGTDLIITLTPTVLRQDEREELAELRSLTALHLGGTRDAATAADIEACLRAGGFALQVALVREHLTEVDVRAVAAALGAGFDTEPQLGVRDVAPPQRVVRGGLVAEPCRAPEQVLRRLADGLPWIGDDGRELRDLVTLAEVGHLLTVPHDELGLVPGLAATAGRAPDVRSGVHVGDDVAGRPALLPRHDRPLHLAFLGATGSGKTSFLAHLVQQDLQDDDAAVVVVDGGGDLVARARASVPDHRKSSTFVLDARGGSPDRTNLLAAAPAEALPKVLAALIEASSADLNPDFAGPVFVDAAENLLRVVAAQGGTFQDVHHLLHEPRELLLEAEGVGDERAAAFARGLIDRDRGSRAELTTWVGAKFHWALDAGVAEAVCAPTPTFALADALAPGATLLVHPGDDAQGGRALTSAVLAVLIALTSDRSLSSPPLSVYLDEVQRSAGRVLRRAMNETRKRNVALHLATQNLTNLSGQHEAVLGNAGHLLVGRSVGPTAMFAEAQLDVDPTVLGRLPNLHAFARLVVDGIPQETFELVVPAPGPSS